MKNQVSCGTRYKKQCTKYVSILLLATILAGSFPLAAFGQNTTTPTQSQGSYSVNGAQNGSSAATSTYTGATGEAVGDAASCVAGKYVSGIVAAAISNYTNLDTYTMLPTITTSDRAKAGNSNQLTPSWDSIAYCVINGILTYITQATVEWINSGFDGNPAFVTDPEQFFTDIGDEVAAGFLQELASSTLGVNICEPFRVKIATDLQSQMYGTGQGAGGSACSLGDIGTNIENFDVYTSGGQSAASLNNWWSVTQNAYNNPYGSYLAAQQDLARRISVKENTATLDLTLGKGFLSYKECAPDTTVTDANGVKSTKKGICTTKTPGSVISDQLDNHLNLGTDRLKLADKFDQVITALVDQLVKTALSEVLTNTQ